VAQVSCERGVPHVSRLSRHGLSVDRIRECFFECRCRFNFAAFSEKSCKTVPKSRKNPTSRKTRDVGHRHPSLSRIPAFPISATAAQTRATRLPWVFSLFRPGTMIGHAHQNSAGTRLLRASPCHITESREQLRPRHPSYESSDSLSLPPKHAWHGLICSSPPPVRAYFHARMRSCSECHRRPARQQFPPLQPRNSETTACPAGHPR
jgi:hypothetical protein